MQFDLSLLPRRIATEDRRESFATEVSRGLLSYILAGNFGHGDKLPSERRLAESLGIGRSIVREAMRSLALLGIIEVRQGDGTYLKGEGSALLTQSVSWGLLLGRKKVADLVEARQYLEIMLAELAGERRNDNDLESLERLLAEMRAAKGNPVRFVAADIAFHYGIAQSAHNETLVQIMAGIHSLLHAWISRVVNTSGHYDQTIGEHDAILDALRNGAPDNARQMMRRHLENAFHRLESTFVVHQSADAIPLRRMPD